MKQVFQNSAITQFREGNTLFQVNNHHPENPIIFKRPHVMTSVARSPQNSSEPTPCNKLEAHEQISRSAGAATSETAARVAARLYSRDAQLRGSHLIAVVVSTAGGPKA